MRILFTILAVLVSQVTYAQPARPGYPQDYFRNPLDEPILLAGNFGECRPGHFHSGLDIKTGGEENHKVHAAADGYISRIKMDKGGFGHALYITHPDGYTTLYAHLNDFVPAIQKFLKQQQYEKKRWDVDLQIPATQFPVKKGEQIAWSGNTGGSTAPHLHFEIRDTKTEHPLNPQLFGLPVDDKIAPVPKEIVFYVNEGSFYSAGKLVVSLEKNGEKYRPEKVENSSYYKVDADTVFLPGGRLGLGVNVNDYMDSSGNTITFFTAGLYMDDVLQSLVTLDNIGYDETRYINAYIDYPARQLEHKWIQCLFPLPGNRLCIFSGLNGNNGWVSLDDGRPHKMALVLTDNSGNVSTISFFACRTRLTVASSTDIAGGKIPFFADQEKTFNNGSVAFTLDNRQLYDNVLVDFSDAEVGIGFSHRYTIGNISIPLHHYFDLRIKPCKLIPEALKGKIVVMYSDGKDEDGRAAAPDSAWYKAKVRNFGTYWLEVDTLPPVIASMQRRTSNMAGARQIAFTVKDNMTSVKTFSGYLDGKWICFEQHGDEFFYKFDEHCPKGKHKLVFKAADENGNEQVYNLIFTK